MLKTLLLKSIAVAIFVAAVGCEQNKTASSQAVVADVDSLALQGKRVYLAQCTACHNANPKLDGSLGPGVAGSSVELLKARIVDGTYPAGYTPKRPTHVMTKLPHLEKDIEALHKYLNEASH